MGIPPAEQKTIFGKFVRGTRSRDSGSRGRGSASPSSSTSSPRTVATSRLESVPGEGSRFTLLIPLETGAMKRVLVVEDEPAIAFGLQADLVAEGYDVEVVGDGEAAARRAREGIFDLVLLDVMLPRKDGFEVCRELRRAGLRRRSSS